MQILPESRSRTSARFILINGVLSRVSDSEYARWVAMHNAGNVAGMGDRQAPAMLADAGVEARS